MAQSNLATIEEWDRAPEPADLVRSLDQSILEATSGALPPAVKIAFDGALGVGDIQRIHDELHAIEIIAPHKTPPLEFMRANGNNSLAEWEYLAGQRFRIDFDMVIQPSSGVMNYERMSMHDTALTREHRGQGGIDRGGAVARSAVGMTDLRLAAMQRRGAFASSHRLSFWLSEAIIGFEIWPRDLAPRLGWDVKRVGHRFREALADLAGFYRLHASGRPSGKIRSWHSQS